MEKWKDVKGYDGFYKISNHGKVISYRRKPAIEMKIFKKEKGYYFVSLSLKGNNKHHRIHRLVAEHFIDNPMMHKQINHKDMCKENNNVENLEWCSNTYNQRHAAIFKRMAKVEKNSNILICNMA